jgi:ABC-type transport system involved in multi-copper enzyme maturation permease subunit
VIRFAWVQSRTQNFVATGALAIVAVVLAISGPHLVHLYDMSIATCAVHGDCQAVTAGFLRNDSTLRTWLGVLVIVTPGIIGIFWGAPLVAREVEGGTFRLAWTQSVTRTRWLGVKLSVIALAGMAVAGILSLMVTWWASPIDLAGKNRFGSFDQRDIVPIGFAAFAFALGVTAGVLIRRTLPSMAATLAVFAGASVAMTFWIRPHLIAPVHQNLAITSASVVGYGSATGPFGLGGPSTLQLAPPDMPNAWIYSTQLVDKTGHAMTAQFLAGACPSVAAGGSPAGGAPGVGSTGSSHSQAPATAQNALADCAAKAAAKFHELVIYQPASRYWAFQWDELAILLGAALILAGFSIWWVRRHLS